MRWVVFFACVMCQCYGDAEKIFCERSQHEELVVKFVKKHLLKHVGHQSFLDIGPGHGRIAHKLADKFAFVTVVDPDRTFWERFWHWGFQAHWGYFQEVDINGGYDLVICSRVLERVAWRDWEFFVRKMHRCREGKALVVMHAPRGKWHRFCTSLNNEWLNSDDFWGLCKRMGFRVRRTEVKNVCRTFDRHEFREMVFGMALEECFTDLKDREWLSREVDSFVEECRGVDGSFTLVFEMDFLVL